MKLKLLKYGGMLSQAHSVMVPNQIAQLLSFPLHLTEAGMFYYAKPGRDQSQTKHCVFPRVVWALYRWLSLNSPPCASQGSTLNAPRMLDVPAPDRLTQRASVCDACCADKDRCAEWVPQRVQDVFGAEWNICFDDEAAVGYVELQFPTLDLEEEDAVPEELGPTAGQAAPAPEDGETSSGTMLPFPVVDEHEALERALNCARSQRRPGGNPAFSASGGERAISEFEDHFYTMAFPELFLSGMGDRTLARTIKITTKEWLEHLMWTGDQRCARHKVFCFVAFSRMNREDALNRGSYFVNTKLMTEDTEGNAVPLPLEAVNERVRNGDNSLARAIFQWSAPMRGSHA